MAQVKSYWPCVSVIFIISYRDIAARHFEWSELKSVHGRGHRMMVGEPSRVRYLKPHRGMTLLYLSIAKQELTQ